MISLIALASSAVLMQSNTKISSALDSVIKISSSEAIGSGFFVVEPNLIVTAAHVLSPSRLTLSKGGEVKCVIPHAEESDIALLITSKSGKPLQLNKEIYPGDEVYAIGNALGTLTNTITKGIVSRADAGSLQLDASLYPGMSGGPVLNQNGLVVGVNSSRLKIETKIGFAIRSQRILDLVTLVKKSTELRKQSQLKLNNSLSNKLLKLLAEIPDGFKVDQNLVFAPKGTPIYRWSKDKFSIIWVTRDESLMLAKKEKDTSPVSNQYTVLMSDRAKATIPSELVVDTQWRVFSINNSQPIISTASLAVVFDLLSRNIKHNEKWKEYVSRTSKEAWNSVGIALPLEFESQSVKGYDVKNFEELTVGDRLFGMRDGKRFALVFISWTDESSVALVSTEDSVGWSIGNIHEYSEDIHFARRIDMSKSLSAPYIKWDKAKGYHLEAPPVSGTR